MHQLLHLNTSHVNLNLHIFADEFANIGNLNTSHVNLNPLNPPNY